MIRPRILAPSEKNGLAMKIIWMQTCSGVAGLNNAPDALVHNILCHNGGKIGDQCKKDERISFEQ